MLLTLTTKISNQFEERHRSSREVKISDGQMDGMMDIQTVLHLRRMTINAIHARFLLKVSLVTVLYLSYDHTIIN